ncbi:NAD-dependent epimerase/dehydratase family protein [Candidatus Aenigmatarchaeota archaeon]
MKCLVTGGAGFIGSNLTIELVKKGHEVIVIDNLATGVMENLESVKNDITFVKSDLQDNSNFLKASKGVDYIFHQGGSSSSIFCDADRKLAVEANIYGFVSMLNAAIENNVKRVIYASTSSIYGNLPPPLKEDMNVTPPNFYAITKHTMEHIAKMFGTESGVETVGFRYMSVYGPKEDHKKDIANMASQFLWSMQKNEQPIVFGDGKQTRDFTYVRDVVNANILAMESKEKLVGEVFNVGSGETKSLNELVDILNKLMEKDIPPKYIENPIKNYIFTQLGDISKIKSILNYQPKFSLEEGLKGTINKK